MLLQRLKFKEILSVLEDVCFFKCLNNNSNVMYIFMIDCRG